MRSKSVPYLAIILSLLLAFPAVAGAVPDVQPAGQASEEPAFVPDQVIVKFTSNASASEKANIKRFYGLKKKAEFNMGAELLQTEGLPAEAYVKMLNNLKHVEYAELDYIIERPAADPALTEITDPYLSDLWGMDNIDAPEAWTVDQGDPRVIVAVIDTGVQISHSDLNDNIWVNLAELNGTSGHDDDGNGYDDDIYGWDFFYGDATVYDGTIDDHGTHVSGTIAAEANGSGVVGVAPLASIMPLKFLGPNGGSSSDAILAIEYAQAKGAHVINASWGGGSYNTSLIAAIDNFDGIFVAAAGNSSQNTDLYAHYPSSYSCENIVSVASLSPNNKKSGFSNYGTTTVDLFAPGAKILSTYPNGYAQMDGTSMAAPHVSGTLALMISHELHVSGYGPYDSSLRSSSELIADLFSSTVQSKFYTAYVATGGRMNTMAALELTPGYGGTEPPVPPEPPVEDGLIVEASSPENGARNISQNVLLQIDFSQDIASFDAAKITLGNPDNIESIQIDPANQDILLVQARNLNLRTYYTLTIQSDAIVGAEGDTMTEDYTLRFRTVNR